MPRSRSAQLLLLLSAMVLVGTAVLIGSGLVGFWAAARALVFTTVLVSAVVLALLVRHTNRQIQQLRAGLDRNVRLIRELTGEQRMELLGRTEEIADRICEMEDTLRREDPHRGRGETEDHPKVLT
ncbi:hypothetical protein [Nocardiopsis kunsanensis]|nr:hypothetical protein [Nocardiopsis kunsanensis]